MVEVYIILKGGNGWGNYSVPLSAPGTLGITGGTGVTMTQQERAFPAEVHATTKGTAQNLHRALMRGTPMG